MSALKAELIRQIGRLGPLTIAEYMTQCLYHPEHGYYSTRDPLGGAGDFVTAPEISQMFGELLGLALGQSWLDQGAPVPFCLAELGPGSGQLMADVLRATAQVPGFHDAMHLHLCEVNPVLIEAQRDRLAGFHPVWIHDVIALPDMPLFLLANEFFDCLPIRQFVLADEGWQEQLVAVRDGALCFASKPAGAVAGELPKNLAPGATVEIRAAANALMAALAVQIGAAGGCLIVVDYGEAGSCGDTLQAVRKHQKVDPLADPGVADLTAHVDFAALATAAAPFTQCSGLTDQGVLLERLGISQRAQALAKKLQGEALEIHISAHRRLTHGEEMGKLFKALALTPQGAAHPPGFDI
ncbi:MAG: class I SAM-dependent methyltransferase [Rhodobacteraceae bacterium]|nr:class I SAM-dependent methyltransferase [Paracoccaceae bacterium]